MDRWNFTGDDEDNINVKYNFNARKYADVGKHYNKTPLFGYDFLDLGTTDYGFDQPCLDNSDIIHYFTKLKDLSKRSIDELIDSSDQGEHIHFYNNPNAKIRQLLKEILNRPYLRDEETPVVGQIGLYTSKDKADRLAGIKSPRIYFMVGPYAVLYVIFYDPYHEINPGAK